MAQALLLLGTVLVIVALVAVVDFAWFARQVGAESPRVSVRILDPNEPGQTRVEIELPATKRDFRLVRIVGDRAEVERTRLEAPVGFVAQSNCELGADKICWIPARGRFVLKPNKPVVLTLPFDAACETTASLRGWCEAQVGAEGTMFPFTLMVGPQDPSDIELHNLRSEGYAKAGELGVIPAELPEWQSLKNFERDRQET